MALESPCKRSSQSERLNCARNWLRIARVHQEGPADSRAGFAPGARQQEQTRKGHAMKERPKRAAFDHRGSTFDSFLEEVGIRKEVEAVAVKRVLAWQLSREMRQRN